MWYSITTIPPSDFMGSDSHGYKGGKVMHRTGFDLATENMQRPHVLEALVPTIPIVPPNVSEVLLTLLWSERGFNSFAQLCIDCLFLGYPQLTPALLSTTEKTKHSTLTTTL